MSRLGIEFDYAHEDAGWMNCCLTIDGEKHELEATWVFPPFIEMLTFLKAIAIQRLPARLFWEEEGPRATFLATPVAEDSPLVHLTITHDAFQQPWFDEDIERQIVIDAFLPPILDLAYNFLTTETDWGTSREEVEKIHMVILEGVPLRSDIHSPQPVEFKVYAEYEIEYINGHIFLVLKMLDEEKLNILLFDTHQFWKDWHDFLAKIARSDLPAQCRHMTTVTFDKLDIPPIVSTTRIRALPVDDPANFRLEIINHSRHNGLFLVLNEVVNREQCVQAFVQSFEKFLREEYHIDTDSEGNSFDLRTLAFNQLNGSEDQRTE